MSKPSSNDQVAAAEEAFEIIELATADIEVLARAFDVISEVCEELNNPRLQFDEAAVKQEIN